MTYSYTIAIGNQTKMATSETEVVASPSSFRQALAEQVKHPKAPFNRIMSNSFGCREGMMSDYRGVMQSFRPLFEAGDDADYKVRVTLRGSKTVSEVQLNNLVTMFTKLLKGNWTYTFGTSSMISFSASKGNFCIDTIGYHVPSAAFLSIIHLILSSDYLLNIVNDSTDPKRLVGGIIKCNYYSMGYQEHILAAFYFYLMLENTGYLVDHWQNKDEGNGPARCAQGHLMTDYNAFYKFLEANESLINTAGLTALYTYKSEYADNPINVLMHHYLGVVKKYKPQPVPAEKPTETPVQNSNASYDAVPMTVGEPPQELFDQMEGIHNVQHRFSWSKS